MTSNVLLLAGAVLVFGTVNWQVVKKESVRTGGQAIYLEMAPRDPRSLMQGDYMALNFALAAEIGRHASNQPEGPHSAIVKLDDRRVAQFVRLDHGEPLEPGELRFRYRMRTGAVWLGTNAFFFHEGEGARYSGARYGEFRVGPDGEAILVDLRNRDLQRM